jgi:hypothetical protein
MACSNKTMILGDGMGVVDGIWNQKRYSLSYWLSCHCVQNGQLLVVIKLMKGDCFLHWYKCDSTTQVKKVALFQSYGCHYSHPRVGWWWDQWDAMGSSASPALLALLPAIPTPSRFWYSIQLDGRPWWPCLPGPWTRGSVRDGYGGISKWYFWKWITGEII